MLLSFLLISVAVLMILLLNLYIDIDFEGELSVAVTLSIFTLHIFKSKNGASNKSKPTKSAKRSKLQVIKLLFRLMEKTELEINQIYVPKIYYDNGSLPLFLSEPILISFITAAVAYLSTKTEKLYFAAVNEKKNEEKLIFRANLKLVFWQALSFLFNYLRIRKKEG